jgi:hypothetical protein
MLGLSHPHSVDAHGTNVGKGKAVENKRLRRAV